LYIIKLALILVKQWYIITVDNTMLFVVHVVGNTGKYKLKVNENGKSDVWKNFPLVYQVENG